MTSVSPPIGLSVRAPWQADWRSFAVDCVEVIADAWLWASDDDLRPLERLRRDVPVYLHALGLNLGSVDGLDPEYVDRLRALAERLDVEAVSDHFGWRSIDGHWSSTFLPVPLVPEAMAHFASRVHAVQDRLRRILVLETAAEYVNVQPPGVDAADGLLALHEACGSEVLLDTCNLRVGGHNIGANAHDIATRLAPITRYVHVAGFSRGPSAWIDDHGAAPEPETLRLAALPGVPVVLEWDRDLPGAEALRKCLAGVRTALSEPRPLLSEPVDGEGPETAAARSKSWQGDFQGLASWCRGFMAELMRPTKPGFDVLHADQVFGALSVLTEAYPVTRSTLGDNFRWLVREMVRQHCARDVHGLTWISAFGPWMRRRPELLDHPQREALEAEWVSHGE